MILTLDTLGTYACAVILLLIACGSVSTNAVLSEKQKQELLDAHNNKRSQVHPTAANMERMVWSDELATIAQNYAEKCIWGHNRDRSANYPGYVGENLHLTMGAAAVDVMESVADWYNEVMNFDYATNRCQSGASCSHFTQVVWAKSSKVGCGGQWCDTVQGIPLKKRSFILVCNYAPGGNYRGVSPYESGTPCSACPAGKETCDANLCSGPSGERAYFNSIEMWA